jgi:hypothetical protein
MNAENGGGPLCLDSLKLGVAVTLNGKDLSQPPLNKSGLLCCRITGEIHMGRATAWSFFAVFWTMARK